MDYRIIINPKNKTIMIKKMYCLLVAVLVSSGMNAQKTSLTVDCQTPGWLSSKINYSDQKSVQNLKVTGYINGTDIKFIRELNINLSLHGIIDLEDANIVAGGAKYYSNNYGDTFETQDDKITGYMFANLDSLQKIILPKSITEFTNGYQFLNTYVDTLVIYGTMKDLSIGDGYDDAYWKTRCIYFPEGIKNLNLNYLFHSHSKLTNQELFLPSSIESITGRNAATKENGLILHCSSLNPENIKIVEYSNNNYSFFNSGTIYVPKGTTAKYKSSIFSKLTIIEDIPVDSVKFQFSTLSTYVGDEFENTATLYPADAIHKNIMYNISDSTLLGILGESKFIAKSYGVGYIYAYSHNEEFVDSCKVQIYNHTIGVNLDKTSASIRIGETIKLTASTLPKETSDNKVTYSSSDNKIAVVSEDGVIRGIAKGHVSIIIQTVDGNHTAECLVTVTQPVTQVQLTEHNVSINVGEIEKLSATVLPTNADNKSLVWSSSNHEVVAVTENGEIEALMPGSTYVKVVSVDNPSAMDSCLITVTQPAIGITLNYVNYTFDAIGESLQLTATVSPENATNKSVKWVSSNESVCVVSNGLVVGVGEGTAVIIATTVDGGHMATCVITVKKKEYLLTYLVDGEVYHTESLPQGEKINLLDEPTKEGYTFSGWSEAPKTMPAENTTISGTFTINHYTITYIIDGEVYNTITVTYGDSITLPEVPEKEGYTFAWIDEVPETMPSRDIVINGSYISADISSTTTENEMLFIYTLDGQQIYELRQGINIVRMKNGRIKKFLLIK